MAAPADEDDSSLNLSSVSNANSLSEPAQEERYNHVKVLGKGAFGEAVLYSKTEDNSLVVWKEINQANATDKTRRDAQNEIEILSMLNHANIITYYNHFDDESSLFIEMEYANGGTLYEKIVNQHDQLDKHGQPLEKPVLFPEKDVVVWYLFQIVSAVDHIHTNGILHRDIKTLNIFLTKTDLIKLGDFGISKVLKNTDMAETVVGTPYYMSPELMRGQQYNIKSDMWAVGCVLYELLSLTRSFDATNRLKLVWGIVQNEIDSESLDAMYSPEIKSLVCQLLSKAPEKRPSAAQVLQGPVLKDVKEEMENRVWTLNASARKARMASSSATETIPVVTSKTSEVYYWGGGRLTPHKLEVFKDGDSALQVAAGNLHFAAVTVEKELYTWANIQGGQALVGQLGHGDTACYKQPKIVASLQNVKAVSCGEEFTACITDDGELFTFGSDYYGCLGCDNAEGDEVTSPIPVEFFSSKPVEQVSCGECHIVVLTQDKEVYSWGCGEFGRLGLGSEDDYSLPQKVHIYGHKIIRTVCAGFDGTFFGTTDGKVLACGSNENNKLGFNTVTKGLKKRQVKECYDIPCKDVPAIVKPLNRYHVMSIATGKDHSAVISDSDRLITFGLNKHGQLGVGDCKPRSGVNLISGVLSSKHIVRAACGDGFTVIATKDNQIYSFGDVDSGRLGISVDPSLIHRKKMGKPTPKPIFGSLHLVSDVSCRHWHCIVIVEKVLKSKTIRSSHQDSFTSSRGSQISQSSQDDSVFSSVSYASDNAGSESPVTCNEDDPDALAVSNTSYESNANRKDEDSIPAWLAQELDDAEFIPMESQGEPTQRPPNHPPSASDNTPPSEPTTTNHTAPPDLIPPTLSSSLDASSISIGLPASQPSQAPPPYVPPLCLSGLSGSGDIIRLQMVQDREKDEEVELLNRQVVQLQVENETLQQRVNEQDARIEQLERKISPLLRKDKKMWKCFDTWHKECKAANKLASEPPPPPPPTTSVPQKARRTPSRTHSLVLYPTHKHKPTYDYESIINKMIGNVKSRSGRNTSDRMKKTHGVVANSEGPTKKYMHEYTQTEQRSYDDGDVETRRKEHDDTPHHKPGHLSPIAKRKAFYKHKHRNIDNPRATITHIHKAL